MYKFERTTNGFNFYFENIMQGGENGILKMPVITPNKRGVNDIGFCCDEEIDLYATISRNPNNAVWQKIENNSEINKTTSFLKIVNNASSEKKIVIRVILN